MQLPMFPLGSVLFPTMVLPLHVFEERYRALTRDVLAGDKQFGVVLIERGHEVGGGDARVEIGTVAQVLEAQELEDGRWLLVSIGSQRFRVRRWLDDDPYPRAEVEPLEDVGGPEAAPELVHEVQAKLRRVAALRNELDEPAPPVTIELSDDPMVAGYQAAAVSGLTPLDGQQLLEIDDPLERLTVLSRMLDESGELLDAMLAQS